MRVASSLQARFTLAALLGAILCAAEGLYAQGTAFVYHGQLTQSGVPVNGARDLRFSVHDDATGGNQLAVQSIPGVSVTLGTFTTTLDFGNVVFNGDQRWLQISVKNNSGNYTALLPRQKFLPTPYAIMANSASNLLGTLPAGKITGSLPASQVSGGIPATQLTGTLGSSQLAGPYSSPLNFTNSGNNFAGNGAALTGVDAATLNGFSAGHFWKQGGNAGTTAGLNFLGTSDFQPLELKVNGSRGFRIEPTSYGALNIIGGAPGNFVRTTAQVSGVTIAGGGSLNPFETNSVFSSFGSIGGGAANSIGLSGNHATIAGGFWNQMVTYPGFGMSLNYSAIGGGSSNEIYVAGAVIGGGIQNVIGSGGSLGSEIGHTIAGGVRNQIGYETDGGSTIGGGVDNFIDASFGAIAGGRDNAINWVGNTTGNAISGGIGNVLQTGFSASGVKGRSVISGGGYNLIEGTYAAIPGGLSNYVRGNFSMAAGYRAKAEHSGSFVWADSCNVDFQSEADDSFSVRSTGGARFVTAVDSHGDPIAGVELPIGGGAWSTLSDRNSKENLNQVNARDVLERVSKMPISTWNYKSQNAAIRHIGPMAQDFAAAFQVGENDRRISTVDADGVALAAIQGLNQKLQDAVKDKEAEIQELKQRLERVERLLDRQAK